MKNKAVETVKQHPKRAGAALIIALAAPIIMSWEGKRNDPYYDIVKVLTVCYGHTGKDIEKRRYSDAECKAMLQADMEDHLAPITRCVPVLAYRPYEGAAALSLSYNIGVNAFCRSTAARRFNYGDFTGGCTAMTWFNKAGGKVVRGLVNRRADERRLCMMGTLEDQLGWEGD